MKKNILIFALTAVFSASLFAGSPAKNKKVEELLELTQWKQMMQSIDAQLAPALGMLGASDAQKAKINSIVNGKEFKTAMMAELVKVYDAKFSEAELDAFLTFYKTSAGQKWITTMPAVFQESMVAGSKVSEKHLGPIFQELQKKMKQ